MSKQKNSKNSKVNNLNKFVKYTKEEIDILHGKSEDASLNFDLKKESKHVEKILEELHHIQ